MNSQVTNVAVLGSTGSIGTSALKVIAASGGRLRAVALTAGSNAPLLAEQARLVRPRWIVLAGLEQGADYEFRSLPPETEVLIGPEGVARVAAEAEVDARLASEGVSVEG